MNFSNPVTRAKIFKFYYLQGQNLNIFLIFTQNQDKIFLILPITGGGGQGVEHVSCIYDPPHLKAQWFELPWKL